MASNPSDQQPNVQDVTFNIPMAGNRGRPVARIRIVPFNSQSAAQQAKAEREEKEKLLRQQQAAMLEKRKKEICEQLYVSKPEVKGDGYSVRVSWQHVELTSNQYSKKLKSSDNLQDLLPSDVKVVYSVKMTAKDKTITTVYSGPDDNCVVEDLKPGGEYSFSVTASAGEFTSLESSPAHYSLPAEAPSTSPAPKIAAKSKSSVTIRWNAPNDNGSPIIEYCLEWNLESDYEQLYCGKEKQFRVQHKFTPGSLTKFRVKARNEVGWSQLSDHVTYTCSAAPPEAPPTLECIDPGVDHVTIRWSSPDNNGALITSYKLEMDDVDAGYGFRVIYQGEELHYTCSKLQRKSSYKFRVCAVNSAGVGAYSAATECVTLPDTPGCPLNVGLKEKVTSTSLHIQWEPPKDDGGSPITSYRLEISTDSGGVFREGYHGEACSCEIKKLSPGTSCVIRVCAITAGGAGQWSAVATFNTRSVCPSATAKPRVKGKPKQESLTLCWDPPQYNGGSLIMFYTVLKKQSAQWVPVGVVTSKDIQDNAPSNDKSENYSFTVTKLSPGYSYTFTITCKNSTGTSPMSEPVTIVTAASPPDAPPLPFVISHSPTGAAVRWEQPVDNGDKIVSYNIKWSEDEDDMSPQTAAVTGGCTYVIKGLSPATTYGCCVQAVNGIGNSGWSPWSSFITLPSSPSVIQHCKVLSKSYSTLVVYWTRPHSNGSPITAYHIELNGTRIRTVTGQLTEATLKDLSPMTDYKIRVQSENKIGVGPFSSMVTVTTLPLPPAPPTLQLQAANQNSLKLSWQRKQDKGFMYTLETRNSRGNFQVLYEGPAQNYKVTRLAPNTTYQFRICCGNQSGKGDWSDLYDFSTTESLPQAPKGFMVTRATHDSLTFTWEAAPGSAGTINTYELQTRLVNTEREFTQAYKGPLMTYTVEHLPGNSVVEARVRAVKLSGQGVGKRDNLFSSFVEVKHRTLQETSQPTTQDEEITECLEDEVVKKKFFTLTTNQYSFIAVLLIISITVFLTITIGNLVT
ncbi:fibronectin type-III domain-containing protein 3A-like isoform X2 [Dysidea avara]|uniref:fibronectin type-III domain-containing protein 3A-like isoform X2 n=1 Tax=Dysidea avara TaxID=196820 RepID=UPI003321B320